jgi:hypothetical protein
MFHTIVHVGSFGISYVPDMLTAPLFPNANQEFAPVMVYGQGF